MTTTQQVDDWIQQVRLFRANMNAAADAFAVIPERDRVATKMHTFNVESQFRTNMGGMLTIESKLAEQGIRHDDPRLGDDPIAEHR